MPAYVEFQKIHAQKPMLNIGVSINPCEFEGPGIFHIDLDRWRYKNFVQADAHKLPFRDHAFKTAVCGDVLEHLVDPLQALKEMRRVASRVVLTTFQEWRLSGPGQHIEEGQKLFAPTEEAIAPYRDRFLERYPEEKISHIPHINQWHEGEVHSLIEQAGLGIIIEEHDYPGVHEGHMMFNYLFVLGRK